MQEFRRRSFELAVRAFESNQTACTGTFCARLELVQLLPTQPRPPRDADATDPPALGDRGARDRELRVAEHIARVEDLQFVPKIGPVRAVAFHGIRIAHTSERCGNLKSSLAPQCGDQALGKGDDIVLVNERGFDIDLCEFRLAVDAQVFVAEAPRDLEVAIEPRHHEQLLIQLRRLRQRVELARMNPARHQVVPRALRRGFGENRSLHFEKAAIAQEFPRRLHQPMSQDNVLLQLRAAQIQVTVAQPQLLSGKRLAAHPRHGNRWGHRWADDLEALRPDLDVARWKLMVPHLGRACDDFAFDEHDALRSKRGGETDGFR